MLKKRWDQLRKTAAAESLRRIRRDRVRAPKAVQRALVYIERHLFDPTLRVDRLREALGIRDNSFSTLFRDACGRAPRRYIAERRLETACRLLAVGELAVWQIAEGVGFSNFQTFDRAFARWAGETPSRYRERARARSTGGRAGASFDDEVRWSDPGFWRRALAGGLTAAEADVVIERLKGGDRDG